MPDQVSQVPGQRAALIADLLTLAIFCGFLFFYGLGSFGLVGADEPRYAQIAREMLARHDWVTPVLNGTAWLEKPVLYYWGAILSYKLFGVSDWAARVPSATMATLLVFSVYLFLRRFRPGSQLDGALIVASSVAMIGFARAASTDMPLTAMFGIALLAWYAWLETDEKRWLGAAYFFLALATLAKGPVAPFLALLIIVAFCLVLRDFKVLARMLWLPGSPSISLSCCRGTCWCRFVIRNSCESSSWSTICNASARTCSSISSRSGTSFRCWWSRFCRGRCW